MYRTVVMVFLLLIASAPSMATTLLDVVPTRFQFEILGVTTDWLVVRENIRSGAADLDACGYPGLDPGAFVGARVHFVKLAQEVKRGKLSPLDTKGDEVMPLYARDSTGKNCTSPDQAERHWREIAARARAIGVNLPTKPIAPVVLGAAILSKACVLATDAKSASSICRYTYAHKINSKQFKIAVALTAVPEEPNLARCQFTGHRFSVALQVAGLDFGEMGAVAPGGYTEHYDCRSQQFEPLRLYSLGETAVLLGGFRGTNMADQNEHPFIVVFPTKE